MNKPWIASSPAEVSWIVSSLADLSWISSSPADLPGGLQDSLMPRLHYCDAYMYTAAARWRKGDLTGASGAAELQERWVRCD
jgi:hypothetical protein